MEAARIEKLRQQAEQLEADTAKAEGAEAETGRAARPVPPPVPAARLRLRHVLGVGSFALCVVAPVILSAWYLWTRAQDRYVSHAGFTVRTEEVSSALELLGGVAQLSGSSSSDTDILYDFIQSADLVARIDADLDLRAIWSQPGTDWGDPAADPVFAYRPGAVLPGIGGDGRGTIEDLTAYWNRMVQVYSDSGTGLIDLNVQAFDPAEAQAIATRIYEESAEMINRLSAIAREDATAYAREELDQAVERLKAAREALTRFRNRTQIIDPSASIQGQMGLLSSLQQQLAQTLIELDVTAETTRASDPRIAQAERRVRVIEDRILAEQRKLGLGVDAAGQEGAFANLLGEYERLSVDREFAERSYTAALTAYDAALAQAQRKTRYLAAHVSPSRPEAAVRPDRVALTALVATFAFLAWASAILVVYALRDRR